MQIREGDRSRVEANPRSPPLRAIFLSSDRRQDHAIELWSDSYPGVGNCLNLH